jgi:hypothetical protein
MNFFASLLLLLQASPASPPGDLDEVARVASVMVDGDVCRRIQTPRSLEYLLKQDKRDRWLGSDNFDVHHEAFIQTKKTLMRLARLCRQPCDVNLWMPLPTSPPRIQILIRNVRELSQFWTWGVMHQEMPLEMQRVLDTGERATVRKRPGMVSVLAPVRDSLGDIVALVEVVAQASADPRENVK